MIKVSAFIAKRRDIDHEEFHAHWREPHGRLTKAVSQIQRYIQNHAIGEVGELAGIGALPYQGIATIWVAEPATLDEIFANPAFQPVKQDEPEFLDQEQLAWLICDSHVMATANDDRRAETIPGKVILYLRGRDGLDPQVLQQRVRGVAQWCIGNMDGIMRAAVDTPRADVYDANNPAMFDAVLELSFADPAAAGAAWLAGGAACLARLGEFVELSASRGFCSREERFIWPADRD